MKVVIDTNIIVSGLLSPFGNPSEIMRLLASGKLTLCFDTRIMAEYFVVLNRPKFKFNTDTVAVLLKELELTGEFTIGIPLKESLPDPDDNMFIEVALASNAECLITGNFSHFPEKLCSGVKIFSPSQFINYFKEHCI